MISDDAGHVAGVFVLASRRHGCLLRMSDLASSNRDANL
jgi:hypothetical protein